MMKQATKNVSGRKSDAEDCQWIQQLQISLSTPIRLNRILPRDKFEGIYTRPDTFFDVSAEWVNRLTSGEDETINDRFGAYQSERQMKNLCSMYLEILHLF